MVNLVLAPEKHESVTTSAAGPSLPEKYTIHTGVCPLVSVFMGFSDMTPSPSGVHKLGISRPPCVKLLLPDWMELSGGLADSDND